MIDPAYVSQVLAWLALWVMGGVAVRRWLATRR